MITHEGDINLFVDFGQRLEPTVALDFPAGLTFFNTTSTLNFCLNHADIILAIFLHKNHHL